MKNALGTYLYNAYKHYGIDNFKFEIICICFDDDCNKYEEYYIKKLNTLAPSGYNLKLGGRNSKHHPDTLAKMSRSLKGKPGVKLTEEQRKKISDKKMGKGNHNFGKSLSAEHRMKISETHKKLNLEKKKTGMCDFSKQLRGLEKGRETMKKNGTFGKRVAKFDKDNNLISTYDSISEAAKKHGIPTSNISVVCNNKPHCKTAAGFIWKFI
jgi:group I intron endonuclease